MISDDPFAPLLRRRRWAARRDRWLRALTRPWRPTRLAAGREGPPNLLLVAIDTLRADVASDPDVAPHLAELAEGGTLFADVTAPAPWTLPSFASALTGLAPCLHGAGMHGPLRNMAETAPAPLSPGVTTLAGHLSACGYATAAAVANPFFSFGLERGFQWYRYRNHDARDVIAGALDWIRCHADRPFFCFVLLNDPHEPTVPPRRHLSAELHREGIDPTGITDRELRALSGWGDPDQGFPSLGRSDAADPALPRALTLKRALYRAAVRHVDSVLGELTEQLALWELTEQTLLVVLSDHGEEFHEHAAVESAWRHDPRGLAGIGHGHTLFRELLHVPWLARGPGVPAGVVRQEPVSLLDVAPTLCRWLEVPPLPLPAPAVDWLAGRPLIHEAAAGKPPSPRLLPTENIAYGPDLVGVREGRWQLTAPRDGSRALWLSDLAADPAEQHDHSDANPEIRDRLLQTIRRWRQKCDEDGEGQRWEAINDRIRRQLEELGYA